VKILFVHQYFGAMGGAETDILLAAESLRRRGHSVSLLYASRTGRGEDVWEQTFSERHSLTGGSTREETDAIINQSAPGLIYFHSLPDLGVLNACLGSARPVVRRVHDHRMYCMRGGKYNYFTRAVCSRPASWRCVFPCLGFIGRNTTGGLPFRWVSYQAKLKEIELNRQCDCMVVYSNHQKQELVRNGFEPARIEVHAPIHDCGHGEAAASDSGECNRVLFVGQLIRGKGVDLLLRALAKVNVPFEAQILGEGNHRPYCQRLCARLGLADRVQFHGFVGGGELKKFYQKASLLAVSSVWPEPFGLVGQEAMFYGLPVVGFDAGGIREWLLDGENGFLVPWKDTDQFAARIEQLLRNKELARRLGARGRELVTQQQDASLTSCPLDDLLRRIVNQRNTRTPYAYETR
jgi:glycosyltransferase involved in cell wall biosynthesis